MKSLLPALMLVLLACQGQTQPVLKFTRLTLSGPALVQPVDITGSGDGSGRLFIVEKRGTIRIIQNGTVLNDFFMDIRSQVMDSGERGLLGLAFHPQFPDSPYIYVNYVIAGSITNKISRFTLNPNNPNDIDETTEVEYVRQTGVQTNHKAGDLAFGPDGYLYFGFGDGGGGGDPNNNGQNNETLLAKMLRIDVNSKTDPWNYGIPADNPFVDTAGRDEIWAYGMRNPWRISFDRETGDFWIADVGQNLYEEINMIPAGTPGGMNFGWDCQEANHTYEPGNCPANTVFTWPIYEYPHSCNTCPNGKGASLTGGFVYRGQDYPMLRGYYICADYVSNYYWMIRQTGTEPPTFEASFKDGTGTLSEIVTFGEDDRGELYMGSLNGSIFSVGTEGLPPIRWDAVSAVISSKGNLVTWTIGPATGITDFEIERSLDGSFAEPYSLGKLEPGSNETTFTLTDPYLQHVSVYYRIIATREDGHKEYSPVAKTLADPVSKPGLTFEQASGIWRIHLPQPWAVGELTLFDLQGKEIYQKKLEDTPLLQLDPPITPGVYFVKIRSEAGIWSERVTW